MDLKRLFDLVAASAGLVVTAPLILALVFFIRRETPGPGFFKQRRIGKGGIPFTLYKLRTMKTGTRHLPTHETPVEVMTPLGAWLRRWKLDELPQLFNVVRGEMSLVGPRPSLETQTALIEARTRLGVMAVRPGITGLAQVEGIDMSDPQRLAERDADYVASQSFLGDLRLLLATVSGRGIGRDWTRKA